MNFDKIDHEITWNDIEKYNFPNQRIGVIIHIENDNKEILLQQRGSKSQDENGLFEDIGGKVENNDESFKSAILREIEEEAGNDINLTISNSIGVYHCFKNNINWIFIIYFGKYISGNFKIMEPDKCLRYKFFNYEEALSSNLVTESCKFLMKELKKFI